MQNAAPRATPLSKCISILNFMCYLWYMSRDLFMEKEESLVPPKAVD